MTIDDNRPRFQDRDIEHSPYSKYEVVALDPDKVSTWRNWVDKTDYDPKVLWDSLFTNQPKPQVVYVDSVHHSAAFNVTGNIVLTPSGFGVDSDHTFPLRDYQEEVIKYLTSFATLNSLSGASSIKQVVKNLVNEHHEWDNKQSHLVDSLLDVFHIDPYLTTLVPIQMKENHVFYSSDGIDFNSVGGSKQHLNHTLHMEPRQLRSSTGALRFYNPPRKRHR